MKRRETGRKPPIFFPISVNGVTIPLDLSSRTYITLPRFIRQPLFLRLLSYYSRNLLAKRQMMCVHFKLHRLPPDIVLNVTFSLVVFIFPLASLFYSDSFSFQEGTQRERIESQWEVARRIWS